LLRTGQWLRLWRQARALVAQGMRWRGVLAQAFGPWCPSAVWLWLNRVVVGNDCSVGSYSAIHPHQFAQLDLPSRARASKLDLSYRPSKDGFAARLWALRFADPGNYNKGVLGGWRVDQRDPTADVRLLEFCLAVPTE